MKSFTIPMKIFLWPIGLIITMSLTTCDLTKNDETPEEQHCQALTRNRTTFDMGTYQYTYFCYLEGEYITLRLISPDITWVCSSKPIRVTGSILLSTNQTKPIQVIYRFWWNTTSPTYSQEIPLEKTTSTGIYYFQTDPDATDYDISGYFPSGSAATLHLSVEFKFITSGDNDTDQDYLRSVFQGFTTMLFWYPY